eukprot:3616721-Amphidinium_carterae.1
MDLHFKWGVRVACSKAIKASHVGQQKTLPAGIRCRCSANPARTHFAGAHAGEVCHAWYAARMPHQ